MDEPSKNHDNCQNCRLFEQCKSPFMESSGGDDPIVLAIGEAPGEWEDNTGTPFVGRSGKLLRETLENVGFELGVDVRFTNVVRCRPPDNKISKKYIKHCHEFLLQEIEDYDPNLVLLFGNTPLNVVLGQSGITTWNGVIVERDGRTYVPLFHPAAVLRNPNYADDWFEGFLKAYDSVYEEDNSRRDLSFDFPSTVSEVENMLNHLKEYDEVAYDTETSSLDPFDESSDIIAVSFYGIGDKRVYAVPTAHPETWWDLDELDEVEGMIADFLENFEGNLIGHNMKYDQVWTAKYFGVWYQTGGDTMLLNHLIDSRRGIHGLKRLAGLHIGMFDYDRELTDYAGRHKEADPERGGSYAKIPLELLLPYAAKDAYATGMLHDKLYDELTDKQKILYENLVLPSSDMLALMQYNGICIDKKTAKRYYAIYSIKQQEMLDRLLEDPIVKKLSKEFQKSSDAALIHDMSGGKEYTDLKITKKKIKLLTKGKKKRSRKRGIFEFNPNSSVQKRVLYYEKDFLGIDKRLVPKTDTGKPTTRWDIVKEFVKDYPIIGDIRYHTLLGKMLSTYLGPATNGNWESGDGRVRSNYNLHGTVTGRPSSTNPNLMNIPTPEKEPGTLLEWLPIKNMIACTRSDSRNGILMNVDYSGAELRVFAALSECHRMIEIHKSGKDFHRMTGHDVSGIPYEKITVPQRYKYKWTNWTLLYGGGAPTLHSMYDIPLDEARKLVEMFFDRFPEVKEYQLGLIEFAEIHGYIESPFGRRTRLPYINEHGRDEKSKALRNKDKRTALNMPIQATASDTLLCSANIIKEMMYEMDLKSSMSVNTVYDSILFDAVVEEVRELASLCKLVMENVEEFAGKYYPALDFSWLICPMKADIEVGSHYGALEHYEDWCKQRGEEVWKKVAV